jgi:hypothetical protein
MNWTVKECIERFQLMCRAAFTPRFGTGSFLTRRIVESHFHSRYETSPLERALKEAFTDDEYLFGGPKRNMISQIKVAVTATSASGRTPIVFGNYNRLSPAYEKGKIVRPISGIETKFQQLIISSIDPSVKTLKLRFGKRELLPQKFITIRYPDPVAERAPLLLPLDFSNLITTKLLKRRSLMVHSGTTTQ